MKILAHSHLHHAVADEPPALKELVKEATGAHVRRIGRFIQLALIGAGRCTQQHALPADTAVYLSSGRGDLEITLEVLKDMVEHGMPPKPLSFINTVSNSACFYIARTFGLHGRSQFVTRRHAPLESALQLAQLDLNQHTVNTALVGTVDIVTLPLADHRTRLMLDAGTTVGESSDWLVLAADDDPRDAIACIDHVVTSSTFEDLQQEWQQHPLPAGTALAIGQHVDETLVAPLQALANGCTLLDYRKTLPWYDSQAGAAIHAWLHGTVSTLLYIDSDPQGRFSVIRCSR